MFSSGPNYTKLKTNLRLAVNRLKLLEKKKTELTQKSRKEIADYLSGQKVERARIRVEHIIREDYLVEAMEIVEMYCDLLLARFGLITQMKELDEGIAEAVSSIVWVAPRLQTDVSELKLIADICIKKYGPIFAEHSRTATGAHRVSEKLMHKLAVQAPPKLLIEKYLIEIAKIYNIEYEPDPQVMKDEQQKSESHLIDLSDRNNLGGGGGGPPPSVGFIGYPQAPQIPQLPDPPQFKPFNYPPPSGGGGGGAGMPVQPNAGPYSPPPFNYNIPPSTSNEKKDLNINSEFLAAEGAGNLPQPGTNNNSPDDNFQSAPPPDNFESLPPRYSSIVNNDNLQSNNTPKPQPRSKLPDNGPKPTASARQNIPNLPNVPFDLPDIPDDDDYEVKKNEDDNEIDFDELNKRFEALKKPK